MPVQILLDQPPTVWTNLDQIKGRVVLRLDSQSSITSIVVKLEGESKTKLVTQGMLTAQPDLGERPRAYEEFHKVLYRTTTVFPPPELADASLQKAFTLNAGMHEYPFEVKVPINNSCSSHNPQPMSLTLKSFAHKGLGDMSSRTVERHAECTLPPTLTSLIDGAAEIRYYLKVTVSMKAFYKENLRYVYNINFLPIEPPRPTGVVQAETYARRRHDFSAGKQPRRSLLDSIRGNPSGTAVPSQGTSLPPSITVDARLPNPPIVTCNKEVPLRIIIKLLQPTGHPIFLYSLHITLTGKTRVRAQQVVRVVTNDWVLFSRQGLAVPLTFRLARPDEGAIVDLTAAGWQNKLLPNSVAPSFETCNIKRSYELDVHVGVGWGYRASAAKNHVVLSLKHHIQIYSGIAPPPQLLTSLHTHSRPQPHKSPTSSMPLRKPVRPPRPISTPSVSASTSASTLGPGPSTYTTTSIAEQFGAGEAEVDAETWNEDDEVPPPSYEDALSENVAPVGRDRPVYEPPVMGAQGHGGFGLGGGGDVKDRRGV